ncbi:MAG: hypothetical protein LQ346_007161, partial [Caloplaca aetnensis]
MEDIFDFIIVGAGASGSLLASRLARSRPQFSVLLIDAGGDNQDEAQQTFGERHTTLMTPGYNWGYKTVPQEQLKDRQIDYSRGKGLGGSTAINFCVYTRGPSADYEHWAQLVGDDTWRWEKVQKRFNKFERFQPPSKDLDKFVRYSELSHGYNGEVDVGMPLTWDPTFGDFLDKTAVYHPRNYDHNSGNPLGIAVCQHSTHNGRRVTASGAFLSPLPENLHIMTNTAVRKVLFEGMRAVGVDLGARKVSSRREVILSAGAIDSPKLLLLSGVGASNELQELGIPVTHDLPGVGKNLQDRLFLQLVTVQKPGSHHRTSYSSDSPAKLDEARKQWANDQTGPLTTYYLPQMIGFIRSDEILASAEFQRLGSTTQQALRMETKPTYEIISQSPSPSVKAPELFLASAVAFSGAEASGEVKLQSSNPDDPPLINPNFLSHPFDRYLAIQSVRETLEFLQMPLFARDQERLAAGPKGREDDEILDYVRNTATSMWHPCGTVKMGRPQDIDTCVDTDFKVQGLQGLRVVDMSAAPFLP